MQALMEGATSYSSIFSGMRTLNRLESCPGDPESTHPSYMWQQEGPPARYEPPSPHPRLPLKMEGEAEEEHPPPASAHDWLHEKGGRQARLGLPWAWG